MRVVCRGFAWGFGSSFFIRGFPAVKIKALPFFFLNFSVRGLGLGKVKAQAAAIYVRPGISVDNPEPPEENALRIPKSAIA